MKRLNGNRMRLVVVGCVAVIVFGGGRAWADFTFGEPANLGPTINTSSPDVIDFISSDGLVMYLDSPRSGGYGNWDIWVSTRESPDDDWFVPENLGPPINTAHDDLCANITADGLEMYFTSSRPGGYGSWDIWISRRATRDAAWSTPQNLGSLVNSSASDGLPWIVADGLELYFSARNRTGGYGHDDIWVTRRLTEDSPWGEPVNLGPVVNSSASECCPVVSSDGLVLFFSEDALSPLRSGGFGSGELWMTRRASVSDPWCTPINLGPMVNTSSYDGQPRLSLDDSMLYFSSERPGGFGGRWGDIYQSQIIPLMDLNGDGIVDAADMCIVVDHWGEKYSLCDIGPMPWGDGLVDVEDLKVLAGHLFEEINDPTLVAHWPLDEMLGSTAHDSVSGEGAFVMGDPLWQPSGGMVDGALQLDGVDDCVITTTGVNPADGSFSVLAWINAGAPGQTIISQQAVSDWFVLDAEGKLMTELKSVGRSDGGSLFSDTIITDGDWHRIGLVWDGLHRCLYVDGAQVAKDTEPLSGLENANRSLYIGVGKDYTADTFFSGLIDDIRIYNRVVSP